MKTLADLRLSIDEILNTKWERRDGQSVPEPQHVKHLNDGVDLDATILYADLAESTSLVTAYKDWFAAEIYKSYLLSASELIKNNGGVISAFDGDRVMGVFIGSHKNSNATKCGLQISYMVREEINPRIKKKYPDSAYEIRHAVGIDTSKVMVARTGIWGSNDLVWVGRAANYAAKLCALRDESYSTFITGEVYAKISESSKVGGSPKRDMWTKFTWDEFGVVAYRSSWQWEPS